MKELSICECVCVFIHKRTDNRVVRATGKGVVGGGGQKRENCNRKNLAWGDGRTMQCDDGVLFSCSLESCMVFLN